MSNGRKARGSVGLPWRAFGGGPSSGVVAERDRRAVSAGDTAFEAPGLLDAGLIYETNGRVSC